jgi:hypothetical protein
MTTLGTEYLGVIQDPPNGIGAELRTHDVRWHAKSYRAILPSLNNSSLKPNFLLFNWTALISLSFVESKVHFTGYDPG